VAAALLRSTTLSSAAIMSSSVTTTLEKQSSSSADVFETLEPWPDRRFEVMLKVGGEQVVDEECLDALLRQPAQQKCDFEAKRPCASSEFWRVSLSLT